MSVGITKKLLRHLYVKRGLSDMEIASFMGIDRTSISHLRKSFGIETRRSTGEIGEMYVYKKLISLGHEVKDMNSNDKTSLFDLLVNNRIRIEVKTARETNNRFIFALANKEECNHIESDNRIRLHNGRTRKLYRKSCDFIICIGLKGKSVYPFIIPSKDIGDTKQNISISTTRETKYKHYFQKWEQIKKTDAPTSDSK